MKTNISISRAILLEMADHLVTLGCKVYVSRSETFNYGYLAIGDSYVVTFQPDDTASICFGASCPPDRQYGTGCRLGSVTSTEEVTLKVVESWVAGPMPEWYGRSVKDRLTLQEVLTRLGDRVVPYQL